VNETDRHRTLKFGYRPTLQPLSEFLWKILAQAEAWEALQAGDVYDTMGAIVLSDTRAKALQPFVLKKPLMEFLRAAHEPRQTDSALAALAAIMTPEEFAGFVAEQRQSDREARPIIGPFSSYTKNHQLALCPVWLDYLKEKYPQPNDFARPDKFNTASGLCNLLGELRYEPAIPYFLQIFDAQKEAGFSAPLSALGRIGAPCLYQLNARLDSPAQAHRLNAMEIMTVVFRNNYKNAVPNPVSEWEFDQMRRTFNEMILPKLTKVAEADAVPAVRAKAAETIATIKTELTKPDEMTGPFIKLSVTAERILRRTALENENGRTVSWHFIKDGHPLIQIASQGRTEQKVEDRGPGVYTVYVSVWSKGDYRIVSNVVSYTIDSSGFKID
jgi:PHD/YefM family antitoxin component YafN of YafNO toxin-antitoxin module